MTPTSQPTAIDALRTLLRREYGIEVVGLTYRRAEWSVGGYTVAAASGDRYYLKVQDLTPWTFAAGSRDFYLPLTRELHRLEVLPGLAPPLPTLDGALWVRSGPYALVLHDYIDGAVVGQEGMTDGVLAELAELVGRLHTATAHLALAHPLYETFEVTFGQQLLVAQIPESTASEGIRVLDEALAPRMSQVGSYLGSLTELQAYARHIAPHMVVCHTDLHGDNLMRDHEGNLIIVDWDNALIAPVEHDMIFFVDDPRFRTVFGLHYESIAGPIKIDADLLRFYYYRRALEDIADYIARIARGDGGFERDQGDIGEILAILDGMQTIEPTVTRVTQR